MGTALLVALGIVIGVFAIFLIGFLFNLLSVRILGFPLFASRLIALLAMRKIRAVVISSRLEWRMWIVITLIGVFLSTALIFWFSTRLIVPGLQQLAQHIAAEQKTPWPYWSYFSILLRYHVPPPGSEVSSIPRLVMGTALFLPMLCVNIDNFQKVRSQRAAAEWFAWTRYAWYCLILSLVTHGVLCFTPVGYHFVLALESLAPCSWVFGAFVGIAFVGQVFLAPKPVTS